MIRHSSYCGLLPVLALCVTTAAWGQPAPTFRGGRLPPDVFSEVEPATPAAATPASTQYRLVSIDVPGSTGTFVYGINNTGLVGGTYLDANNNFHGLAWWNGTSHTVDNPGSSDTSLGYFNNSGVSISFFGDPTTAHAALYSLSGRPWTALPDIPGMPNNEGYGINDSGVAVGVAGGFPYFGSPVTGVSWIWDPTSQSYSFFAVPQAAQYSTYAQGLNNKGQIVGFYFDTRGVQHGFLKEGETYTTIDVPGAMDTFAFNINNSGAIAGAWINSSGRLEGFVRTSDGVFTVVDFPGGLATQIGGINDSGDICGFRLDPATHLWTAFVGFMAQSIKLAAINLHSGDTAVMPVSLSSPAADAVFVTLTSSDPSIVSLSTASSAADGNVIIEAGQTSSARLKISAGRAGLVTITAAATGYAAGTVQLIVSP